MIHTYPDTRRETRCEEMHGLAIADPYRWLEDATDAGTRTWTTLQDEYARSILESLPGRAVIRRRFMQLMALDSAALPLARAGRYVFSGRKATDEHHAIRMRRGADGPEEIIVDPRTIPGSHSTVELMDVSASGRLVAYSVRSGGEDEVEVRIRDVDRAEDLPDVLPKARYLECALTDAALYYVRVESTGCRVYRRELGGHPDQPVFSSDHPERLVSCALSDDGRFLLLQVQRGAGRSQRIEEIYVQDLAHESAPRRVDLHPGALGTARLGGPDLFLLTTANAPNHRIVALNIADGLGSGSWREVVPEGPSVIEKFSVAAGRVFVQFLENVTSQLRVFRSEGTFERELSFGALGQISKV